MLHANVLHENVMQKEAFKNIVTTRAALTSIILVASAFIYYFYTFAILKDLAGAITSDNFTILLMWGMNFSGAILSALAATLVVKKKNRRDIFLVSWMLLGAVFSFGPLIGSVTNVSGLLTLAFLFGVSFGIGMPSAMGYFTDHTSVENRGRLGGLIMLANGVGLIFLGMIATSSIPVKSLILAVFRISGLLVFLAIKPKQGNPELGTISYRSLVTQRSFLLYLVPWILFSLVNYLSLPVFSNRYVFTSDQLQFSTTIGNIVSGFSAFVGGFLTDSLGRKRMSTTGFVALGIGYTILGVVPDNLLSLYFYSVVDGIAWGILFVVFVVTVWGDLSHGLSSDKYYAVAGIPFFVSLFLRSAIGPYVEVSSYAVFSFTAFFLFLGVLPLMYAPETLPEKTMRDRELKLYVEKAQKVKQKYA